MLISEPKILDKSKAKCGTRVRYRSLRQRTPSAFKNGDRESGGTAALHRTTAPTLCLTPPFQIGPKSLFFITLAGNEAGDPLRQELKRPVSIFH